MLIQLTKSGGSRAVASDTAADLAAALRRSIEGEVRFDGGSRALYATDASNYRQPPIGVVIPKHVEDVLETVHICSQFDVPILGRGGGTSLAGQCCNTGVVLDFSKYMNRVLDIDLEGRRARVQPGCVLDTLRNAITPNGLTYGPDPATHNHCTFGGMIGNNSCGVHSQVAGRTDQNVEELEVLTCDGLRLHVGPTADRELENKTKLPGREGEIYRNLRGIRDRYGDRIRERFPDIPRRVSGYGLPWLLPENGFHVARALVGSESTCVLILEATVKLMDAFPKRTLVVLGYSDVFTAADHVVEIGNFGPIGLEGIDTMLSQNVQKKHLHEQFLRMLPDGGAWLLVEFGADSKEEADEKAHRLIDELGKRSHAPSMKLFTDDKEESQIWEVRESGLGATAFVPGQPDAWPGWEDSAVHPAKFGSYLRDLQKLYDKYGYIGAKYGHFGQGLVHTRITFDMVTADGVRNFRSFISEAADLVSSYGGSLSGEHGDGQARGEFLVKLYGEDIIEAFREFKRTWDPDWKMNPGKVVDAYPVDTNLRLGADYNPPQPHTSFEYPREGGSFSRAILRCVGVGKCRRDEGATMCPSYRVTKEEMHSTRGRARLLWEMLNGDVLTEGWRSAPVREALDLCLSCKGCKGDCPVNVDLATYKAEFLYHYYSGRLRPRYAYAFGLIPVWARLGSCIPNLVNFATQTPGLSSIAKAMAGMSQSRQVPKFATQTFRDWFRRRVDKGQTGSEVVLWPDTFNNYFHPETAQAAVRVLESAGCRVVIPEVAACCGRPLYDYGMLDTARSFLKRCMKALEPYLRKDTPIVGLEPSCVAVFRDEIEEMFPTLEDAKRLRKNTHTLGEFLGGNGYLPTHVDRDALLHGHCHQKAVMGLTAEEKLYQRLGLRYRLLDSGCCGMAGSFGFEEHKYRVSQEIGELVLLPEVRKAPKTTVIVADGFSCRTQIEQGTDRQAMHTAEVIDALVSGIGAGVSSEYPERRIKKERDFRLTKAEKVLLGIGAGVALILYRLFCKKYLT